MRLWIIMLILLLMNSLLSPAQTATREYQLKAAFLLNFTHFVEWPETIFPSNSATLVIGVLGQNPFGNYLEEITAGEKVNGHPVAIHYYKNMEAIKTCHILFINFTETNKLEQAIEHLKNRNILTVSDAADFPRYGGMIRFFTKDNKIKIQVNVEAVRAASLVISSKLLRLAEIFNPKENS